MPTAEELLAYHQVQHSVIEPGHIHRIANWVFPTIAARNAAASTLKTEDIGKVCQIVQGNEFYALISVAPVYWAVVGNNGIYAVQTTVTPVAGILDVSSRDYRIYNVLLNQNVNTIYLGSNTTVDICIQKTLIFWQQGTGGFNVAIGAWPTMRWENGMLPLIDTSNQGVTSIELMYPYGQMILGVQ